MIGQLALSVLFAWQEQLSPYRSWPKAELELALTMPDQKLHYFEVRIFPIRDRRGQLSGRVVMARDVTNQHWVEMIGYSAEELYPLTPPELTHPDDRAPEEELRWAVLDGRLDSYARKALHLQRWPHFLGGVIRHVHSQRRG